MGYCSKSSFAYPYLEELDTGAYRQVRQPLLDRLFCCSAGGIEVRGTQPFPSRS